MAEEFQSGVCGGNWWMNSYKISPFMGGGLSPCSPLMSTTTTTTSDHLDHMGIITNYGPSSWQMMTDQLKPIRSTCNYKDQNSAADNSDSGGSSSILMDSSLPLIGFGLSSSSSSDWNQALLSGDGRGGESYNSSGLQEIQKDWSPEDQDSITINNNNFKLEMNNIQDFSNLDHQQSAAATAGHGLLMNCSSTTTNSTSPPHSYGYSTTTSSLIQSLFDPDPPEPSQQQPIFNSNNYFAANNSLNDHFSLSPTTTCFLKQQQQQQQQNSMQFSNNTPFWNASAATAETDDMTIRTNNFLLPTSQPQFLGSNFDEKTNFPNLITTQKKPNNQELRDSGTVPVDKGSEPAFKRHRIETPSPLPTFKVRKEKLGDRITALQQLVSPFGKTDTASVLHEAIEYIKYLHDQVSVLSTPYMKNGNPIKHQQQGSGSDQKLLKEEPRQDLKSRGLCLVPITSTFPVANETPADFWTPTFGVGSTFR